MGEFKNSVKRNFKLADYLAGFELDVDAILELAGLRSVSTDFEVKDRQDITVTTNDIYEKALEKITKENPGAEITPVGIYQPEGAGEKNITFHLEWK